MKKMIIGFFVTCFILSSNIAFSSDDSTFINKQQEFEQLKIEVERLKAKKAELEIENKRLSNLLKSNINSNDSKIKLQLEEKLFKITDDNNQKEKIINQKQEELSKAKKEKAEIEIKKAEKKKDLEFRKKEVEKAETLLKTINEENTKLINDCKQKLKGINEIEDNHGLARTRNDLTLVTEDSNRISSNESVNNKANNSYFRHDTLVKRENNNSKTNSEKQKFIDLILKNNSSNNSKEVINRDFTYSLEKGYIKFRIEANNLNNSVVLSIYNSAGSKVSSLNYSKFKYNKEGFYELFWDLKNLAGYKVQRGTYIAKIVDGNKTLYNLKFAVY